MMKPEKSYCFGCGQPLQCDHPHESGYVPSEVMAKRNAVLCQRCFRLQYYHEDISILGVSDDFLQILESARNKHALIVYVIDLFSFEFSFIDEVNRAVKGCDVLVVANKRDVLPKSLNDDRLVAYIAKKALEVGLKVVDVIISSASKNYHIDEFMEKVLHYREGKDVYVVGAVSTGKSSLINTLLKNYSNETTHYITTSPYPGTTLDVIEVPLDDHSFIYDTPGISVRNSMVSAVEKKVIRTIVPTREIKTRVYQLLPKQSLLLGGLARIDFESGSKANFTIFIANSVDVQRTKLEKAESTFFSLIKHRQIIPVSERIQTKEDFDCQTFEIPEGSYQLYVVGYAWIQIHSKGVRLVVTAPKNVDVILREIGYRE